MYIYLHTHHEGVYVCVHIGVGFGVACSGEKAIPGPRIAEQQQCSPAFFVHNYACKSGPLLAEDRFFVLVYFLLSRHTNIYEYSKKI